VKMMSLAKTHAKQSLSMTFPQAKTYRRRYSLTIGYCTGNLREKFKIPSFYNPTIKHFGAA